MKRADRALREAGRSALVERASVRIDIVADRAKSLLHRQTNLNIQGPTSADAQSEPITVLSVLSTEAAGVVCSCGEGMGDLRYKNFGLLHAAPLNKVSHRFMSIS